MRRSHHLTSPSAHRLVRGVLAGCYQPRLLAGPSRRYCLRVFPRMPELPLAVPLSALAWFFPSVIGLPQESIASASHFSPRTRLFTGAISGLQLFRYVQASQLLASRIAPTAVSFPTGQLRRLLPSRTCVVAFARIGYAIGQTTGN
jgi:hypothetical protein